jgi:glucosamine--fructose-6-phosphate aminotransferase (isomerizing)
MCTLHAEAFSAAEVLHGPATLAGPEHPVIALVQEDETAELVRAVARRLREQRGKVLIAEPGGALPLPPPSHAVLRPLQILQASYTLLAAFAARRGRDPDKPPFLRKQTCTL